MSEEKESRMLIYSDFGGFADKNDVSKYPLSDCLVNEDFFKALRIFMKDNDGNKIAFIGGFFDNGSYVIDCIFYMLSFIDCLLLFIL